MTPAKLLQNIPETIRYRILACGDGRFYPQFAYELSHGWVFFNRVHAEAGNLWPRVCEDRRQRFAVSFDDLAGAIDFIHDAGMFGFQPSVPIVHEHPTTAKDSA